jgi:RHS repeat-associated protein
MAMSVRYTNFGDELVAEDRGGVSSFYVPDNLGSTVAMKNTSGTTTDSFTYWPYGEIRTRTGSTATPFTFVGNLGYYQVSTSRYYVRARDLRPDQARWQTVDPLWPQEMAYGYVGGSPLFNVDPSGKGTGSCAVYYCRVNSSRLKHAFTCVDGPNGGCSGGLSPGMFGGPGDKFYEKCSSITGVTCTRYSTDCKVAQATCAALKSDPGTDQEYWLDGFCWGFAKRKICDGCKPYPAGSAEYKNCVCNAPCPNLMLGEHTFQTFGPNGPVFCSSSPPIHPK